jgi:glycosyltransferase involved in cell wall biosynthesis
MKIITVLFEDIDKDPRASKFRDVLSEHYDVTTLGTSFSERVLEGKKQTILLKKGRKYINWFSFFFKSIVRIIKNKPDAILSHNYDTAFPCWLASKVLKVPLAYDAYEFYAPQRGVQLSKRDMFFFVMEKYVIKRADLVFSANIERSRLMKSGFKLKDLPVPILNIPSFNCISKNTLNNNVRKDVVVVYEGFISFTRFVDLLIDAFAYLPNHIRLVIIGDGPDVDKMKALIETKDYKSRIDYRGRINSNDVIPSLSKCDIGFVGYPFSDLNNRYCSPNKIYEYPAAGLPFISTMQSPIWQLTSKYNICAFYDPHIEGEQSIANAIMQIVNHYDAYTKNIRAFIKDNTWDKEAIKIREAFRDIV